MDPKKRSILVIAIAITMIAGVLSSFGLPFFIQKTTIVLPEISVETGSVISTGKVNVGEDEGFQVVAITTKTVQDVIGTLHRKESFYRELTVERFWGSSDDVQGSIDTVMVWTDGDYCKTVIRTSSGSLQTSLIADGKYYIWYGSDRNWVSSNTDAGDVDLMQNIPTYEDILRMQADQIVRAGYETKLGYQCVFVEAKIAELDYLERYWVSTETGILVAAETTDNEGNLVYQMKEKKMTELESSDRTFALPDGTILHRIVVTKAEE